MFHFGLGRSKPESLPRILPSIAMSNEELQTPSKASSGRTNSPRMDVVDVEASDKAKNEKQDRSQIAGATDYQQPVRLSKSPE
jgi:hypothetical protein